MFILCWFECTFCHFTQSTRLLLLLLLFHLVVRMQRYISGQLGRTNIVNKQFTIVQYVHQAVTQPNTIIWLGLVDGKRIIKKERGTNWISKGKSSNNKTKQKKRRKKKRRHTWTWSSCVVIHFGEIGQRQKFGKILFSNKISSSFNGSISRANCIILLQSNNRQKKC